MPMYCTAKNPIKKYGINFGFPIVNKMIANPIAGNNPPATENPDITQSGNISSNEIMASVPNKVNTNTGTNRSKIVASSG